MSTQVVVIALAVSAAALAAGGCSATKPAPDSEPGNEPSIAPPPGNPEVQHVADAYVRFWDVSLPVDQLPPDQWRPVLAVVAAEPMLTQLVTGTHWQQEHNIRLYGRVRARVRDVRIDGSQAMVRDCQDASRTGQADRFTGAAKTVGVARNPVDATLVRSADGIWRVSRIRYPQGSC